MKSIKPNGELFIIRICGYFKLFFHPWILDVIWFLFDFLFKIVESGHLAYFSKILYFLKKFYFVFSKEIFEKLNNFWKIKLSIFIY